MYGFIKKRFFTAMTFFNLSNVNSLVCVSMNNQECKIRTEIINLNTDEPMFYPYPYIPLNKIIYFPTITIIITSVTKKNYKYYPQLFLDDYLYEV